ncbi:hypothetical protein [Burkholderia sp. Z1]|nr:hypothetical protein [Burkholderia sp. Z1]
MQARQAKIEALPRGSRDRDISLPLVIERFDLLVDGALGLACVVAR